MEQNWTTIIKPQKNIFKLNLGEVFEYIDLIFLLVKRNFSIQYKQTILGPLWFLINPLLTTFIYTVIFGNIAGLGTDGVPHFVFYLCSTALWQYFAACLNNTSNTFTANAAIFGKVYFPRITVPISLAIYALVNFGVVFIVTIISTIFYMQMGANVKITACILLVPILVLQTALLGLGVGIIISSLTTKYRDLAVLVTFGVQLWMYATPVVYSISELPEKLKKICMLNPMTPIMNNFRYAMLGSGILEIKYWLVSAIVTIVLLLVGIVLFNKVERTFMDTV